MVGAGLAELRLVAAPFLAAADLAAALRPFAAGRRAPFPFEPAAPPRDDPLLPPRPPAEPPRPPPRPVVPVPPLRVPDRLAEVRDPAPRPAPLAVLRPPDVADVPARPDLPDPPDDEPDPLPAPRLAPRGGTLGRITSGDSSL